MWAEREQSKFLLTTHLFRPSRSCSTVFFHTHSAVTGVNGGGWGDASPNILASPLAATNLCQSSQCHIQMSVDCHSSYMNGDIWRWHSTSHHSLEDRLLKLANTICYINGPRALILPIEKSMAAQFHSWLIRYLFYYCDHKKRSFQSKMHQKQGRI